MTLNRRGQRWCVFVWKNAAQVDERLRLIEPKLYRSGFLKKETQLSTRYLIMDTPIEDAKVHTFISWVTGQIADGATGINVAFSTTGGSVAAGILMANYISALPINITMHNVSTVGSIGIPIYAAARVRMH